jgi:hypothetical protein
VQRASPFRFPFILTPLSLSLRPVSNYQVLASSLPRVPQDSQNGRTADSNGSCCLPTCIFTTLSSPLLFHKAERGTCIPGCAFLVSTEALQFHPRPIYSLRATTSRVSHTVKQELISTPIIVPYDFGRQAGPKPYLCTVWLRNPDLHSSHNPRQPCLQSLEGPPQLFFSEHKPHTFSSAA